MVLLLFKLLLLLLPNVPLNTCGEEEVFRARGDFGGAITFELLLLLLLILLSFLLSKEENELNGLLPEPNPPLPNPPKPLILVTKTYHCL